MSQYKITQLTPEQEALIPFYREKWRAMPAASFTYALSTEQINHQKVKEAIEAAYEHMGILSRKVESNCIFNRTD